MIRSAAQMQDPNKKDHRKKQQNAAGKEESELLPDHRENEIGMRFGQKCHLLTAVSDPAPMNSSGPESQNRLPELVGSIESVSFNIEKGNNPSPPRRTQIKSDSKKGDQRHHRRNEIKQPRSSQIHHAETDRPTDRKHPVIGLKDDQTRNQSG